MTVLGDFFKDASSIQVPHLDLIGELDGTRVLCLSYVGSPGGEKTVLFEDRRSKYFVKLPLET